MTAKKPTRMTIIDALREIALAGIVICHMVENFIGAPAPESFNEAVRPGTIDAIVDGLIFFFLRGKFIALFSFLFGLSFFIQMDNGAKKGTYFGGRFLWRLALLLLIGYAHSLFYRGDILTIYAILGVFLIPFYRSKNKLALGFAALLFLGLGRYIIFFLTHGDSIWGGELSMDSNAPGVIEYYNILKNGSLFDVFNINAVDGHKDKMDFQFNFFGRGYYTFAFFLVGLYVGRSGFFKNFREEKKLTRRILIWSGIVFVLGLIITATSFASLGENATLENWTAMTGLTGMDLANTAMTFIWIAVFVILYRKVKWEKWLSNFAPYGRMALTNYVLQSLIGTAMLYGWGLGLIGELRHLYTFALAFILIAFQVWYSKLWLRHFAYGPLEWAWRSLTFFKIYPMRK